MVTLQININSLKSIKTHLVVVAIMILSSISFHCQSQVSGFLGKRFIIGVEVPAMVKFSLNPGIFDSDDFSYGYYAESDGDYVSTKKYKELSIVYRPTIKLEYVMSRKTSIEGIFRFFSPRVESPDFSENYRIGSTTFTRIYVPIERVKMNTTSFGLRFKWYAGDAISPIGIYQAIGMEYSQMKFAFEDNSFSAIKNNGSAKEVLYKNPSPDNESIFIFTYGVGKQHALNHSLLLNFGLEFGIPFAFPSLDSTVEESEWTPKTSGLSLRKHSLINIVLGLSLAG